MRAASSSCFLISAISASDASIFFTSSSISTFNRETVSVCSSIVLAATTAVRPFSARSFSHSSLMATSFDSSFFKNAIILSMASITASKWPVPFVAESISANCFKRVSPLLEAAVWSVLTASNCVASDLEAERLRALAPFNCKNENPCDLKERLNKSRLSSLRRMATALLNASISPWRRTLRSFHSSFLVARAALVSLMNLRSASF
mmetsp:Transcript_36997/g.85384  ORF Transcript_36997/g.85384 Transcript_36997/m.85384 type:complete len:206 (-) Transcript_36997:974-1591(-)